MHPDHHQQVFWTLFDAHTRLLILYVGDISRSKRVAGIVTYHGHTHISQFVTNLPTFLQLLSILINHHSYNGMFKITTRPPTSALFPSQDEVPSSHRKHPAELEGMDIDDVDMGGPSSLAGVVTPGEVITSAKEFMRFVAAPFCWVVMHC